MINSLLKVQLAKCKMTQKQLAEATGVRLPTISQIALGTIKHMPIDALDKICTALNCQPGDIFEHIKE